METKWMSKAREGMSLEMNVRILEWWEQHPRATFREVEAEIDRRLDELRAKMLSDTANLSTSAAWIEGPEGPMCPHCGAKLAGKGLKRRKLQVRGENEVELERKYGVCPECGQGIFPPG